MVANMLNGKVNQILAMAMSFAENSELQQALSGYDGERAKELTFKSFQRLKNSSVLSSFNFICLPPYRFFRAHKPDKYGDDLCGFRFADHESVFSLTDLLVVLFRCRETVDTFQPLKWPAGK
jgi:methyl-accepting chemotaxis protein